MLSKEEIKNILGTSETNSDGELLELAQQKLSFFNNLINNAPSEYLKKIYTKNLDEIQLIVSQLSASNRRGGGESNNANSTQNRCQNNENRQSQPQQLNAKALLIRHTENLSSKTFELNNGENYLVRSSQNLKNEILIENDAFVSRLHAVLKVKNDEALISDAGLNGFKESKNGVYINGKPRRIVKEYTLHEGDTIQIGNTKLVFKWMNTHQQSTIEAEVNKTEYISTVVINLL
jgi:pSer/pThr/pTyr-binding forkhead associated (FHA) protein